MPNLKMTTEETNIVKLCLLNLNPEEVAHCHDEALRIILSELQTDDYAGLLVQTIVPVIERHVRNLWLKRELELEGPKRSRQKR